MNTWLNNLRTSPRTSIGGILLSVAGVVGALQAQGVQLPHGVVESAPLMLTIGGFLMGQARQGNVTSEQARAK